MNQNHFGGLGRVSRSMHISGFLLICGIVICADPKTLIKGEWFLCQIRLQDSHTHGDPPPLLLRIRRHGDVLSVLCEARDIALEP